MPLSSMKKIPKGENWASDLNLLQVTLHMLTGFMDSPRMHMLPPFRKLNGKWLEIANLIAVFDLRTYDD